MDERANSGSWTKYLTGLLNTWLFFKIPLRGRPRESLQTTGRRLMPFPLQHKLAVNCFRLWPSQRQNWYRFVFCEKVEGQERKECGDLKTWVGFYCESILSHCLTLDKMRKRRWEGGEGPLRKFNLTSIQIFSHFWQHTWAPEPRVWVWDKRKVGALRRMLLVEMQSNWWRCAARLSLRENVSIPDVSMHHCINLSSPQSTSVDRWANIAMCQYCSVPMAK